MSIGNIDSRRWKSETTTWKIRSSALRAVDKAIDVYCAQGGGTPANLAALKKAFEAWKNSKEDWKSSERNQRGIVAELEGYLSGAVSTTNAYMASQEDGRVGLLYVFGGLQVDTKLFNLIVESVWDSASAVMNFDGVQSAIGDSLASAPDLIKDKLPGAPAKVLDNALVQKGRDMATDKIQEKWDARNNVNLTAGLQKPAKPMSRPVTPTAGLARRGGIIIGHNRTPPVTGAAFSISSGLMSSQVFERPATVPQRIEGWLKDLMDKIREALRAFANKVWAAIRKKFDEYQEEPVDAMVEWGSRLGSVIEFIVGKVAAQAAPFVGGAIAITKGLVETVRACASKYETYILGKNVDISPGHPQAIVNAIELIQSIGIGKGLYETFKAAGQLALDATTGAGGIASLVVSCCEILAKFIHRLWDSSRMKTFAKKCKELYDKAKTGDVPRAGEFGLFLRRYLLTTPTLACLGMVSNYAGDTMQWLDMNNTFIAAQGVSAADWKKGNAEFDKAAQKVAQGREFLDNVKGTARSYLVDSGFEFSHSDASVAFFFKSDNLKKPTIGHTEAPKPVNRGWGMK